LPTKSTRAYGFSAAAHPLHRTGSYGTAGRSAIARSGVYSAPRGSTHFAASRRVLGQTFLRVAVSKAHALSRRSRRRHVRARCGRAGAPERIEPVLLRRPAVLGSRTRTAARRRQPPAAPSPPFRPHAVSACAVTAQHVKDHCRAFALGFAWRHTRDGDAEGTELTSVAGSGLPCRRLRAWGPQARAGLAGPPAGGRLCRRRRNLNAKRILCEF